MNVNDALLCRDAETERKAVVPCSAMDVETIGSASPKAVVRDPVAEESEERPMKAEAEEAHLPAVRVPGKNEIALPFGQMAERAGVVQQDDP
jgi:hypothetical protein